MMLRGTCPTCGLPLKASWPDRPEDKGVELSQKVPCFACRRGEVEMSGKGGPAR